MKGVFVRKTKLSEEILSPQGTCSGKVSWVGAQWTELRDGDTEGGATGSESEK